MSNDTTELFNQALSEAMGRGRVTSPDEPTREAELCSLWYDSSRREVLSAAFWRSARTFARLAPKATRDQEAEWVRTDPSPNWSRSFALPADMLRPRYLDNYANFTLDVDPVGKVEQFLMTDAENPILYYTFDQANIPTWEPTLRAAIVAVLGARVSTGLNGKLSVRRELLDGANNLIESARSHDANDEHTRYEVLPEWIQMRDYANPGFSQSARYIYPFGEVLAVGNSTVTVHT